MTQIATHFFKPKLYYVPPHAIREVELADTLNLLSENLNQNLSLNEQRAEQQAVLTSMTERVLASTEKSALYI